MSSSHRITWSLSESSMRHFERVMPLLRGQVDEKLCREASYEQETCLREHLDFFRDLQKGFADTIFSLYHLGLWDELFDEAQWVTGLLAHRGLSERCMGLMLRTWVIAIHSAVPRPEAAELTAPLEWLIARVSDLFEEKSDTHNIPEGASQLLEALIRNDRRKAEELVVSISREDASDETVIEELFIPVLNETGRMWRENRISVAEEHLITAQLRRLSHAFFRSRPAEPHRPQRYCQGA